MPELMKLHCARSRLRWLPPERAKPLLIGLPQLLHRAPSGLRRLRPERAELKLARKLVIMLHAAH